MAGEDSSGLWDGLYSYPRILAPVSFVADLKETRGWLTGATGNSDERFRERPDSERDAARAKVGLIRQVSETLRRF